ncbi:MAG TPA: hypothetical protein VL418_07450 [Devosiaceae bacterium]|nr:hypothetical protein [Devosiaceae bacterium]
MCGLCGVLSHADHWTIGPAGLRDAGAGRPEADRHLQAFVANETLSLFGLKLESWGGRFVLRGRTGKTAVIDNLGTMWVEAERLLGRPCDPLDPAILAKLEAC